MGEASESPGEGDVFDQWEADWRRLGFGWTGEYVLDGRAVRRASLSEHMRQTLARRSLLPDPWRVGDHVWDAAQGRYVIRVSTVFLGYDRHAGVPQLGPELFETMVWVDGEALVQEGWPDYETALMAHETIADAWRQFAGCPADYWIVNDGRELRLLPARIAG